jgi:uncharacterized membrane protein YdbT with pleckstrin-like domain
MSTQRLGTRTFAFLFFQSIAPAFFLFVVLFFVSAFRDTIFPASLPTPTPGVGLGDYLIIALLGGTIILILIGIVSGFIRYYSTSFETSDFGLTINKGFLSRTETSIPYRQVQNIYTTQTFFLRILGIGKLIILTAGQDPTTQREVTLQAVFPVIDVSIADSLEVLLLKKANVQDVHEVQ